MSRDLRANNGGGGSRKREPTRLRWKMFASKFKSFPTLGKEICYFTLQFRILELTLLVYRFWRELSICGCEAVGAY